MKLQTPEFLNSHPFEPYIENFILDRLIDQAQFANHVRVSIKLIVEDLKVLRIPFARVTKVLHLWYTHVIFFIKNTKIHLDKVYLSMKNLYEMFKFSIKLITLLRDLCVQLQKANLLLKDLCLQLQKDLSNSLQLQKKLPSKDFTQILEEIVKTLNTFTDILSTLDFSTHEITQQINLEQTNYLTTSMQFKDSIKTLESNLAETYKILEPIIDPETPVLVEPVSAETLMNTPYAKYLDMPIEEIVEQLYTYE